MATVIFMIFAYSVFGSTTGGIVGGVILDENENLSDESRTVIGILAGLFFPLVWLYGVGYIIRYLPSGLGFAGRFLGRGTRDVYRLARPKDKLPKMRLLK